MEYFIWILIPPLLAELDIPGDGKTYTLRPFKRVNSRMVTGLKEATAVFQNVLLQL